MPVGTIMAGCTWRWTVSLGFALCKAFTVQLIRALTTFTVTPSGASTVARFKPMELRTPSQCGSGHQMYWYSVSPPALT